MRVAFRVDSSFDIGYGHLTRCLTLAKKLFESGVECHFISSDLPGSINDRIIRCGFKLHVIPYSFSVQISNNWVNDSMQSKNFLEIISPKWLIIDNYNIDSKWEKKVKNSSNKLMVIDDLANRTHICDILLDQNLYSGYEARYNHLIPRNCHKLLGPKYCLLQSDYQLERKHVKIRNNPLKNFFIFFGDSDKENLTFRSLALLNQVEQTFGNIDVVISKKNVSYYKIKKQVDILSNANLYSDVPSLAPLISKADLAIGAGGSTTYERLSLGLPSLVITLAKNQEKLAHDLHNKGLIEFIGRAKNLSSDKIISSINKVLNRNDIDAWSEKCISSASVIGTKLVADKLINFDLT